MNEQRKDRGKRRRAKWRREEEAEEEEESANGGRSASVLNECKHEWVSNAAETDCYMLTASGGTFWIVIGGIYRCDGLICGRERLVYRRDPTEWTIIPSHSWGMSYTERGRGGRGRLVAVVHRALRSEGECVMPPLLSFQFWSTSRRQGYGGVLGNTTMDWRGFLRGLVRQGGAGAWRDGGEVRGGESSVVMGVVVW